MDILKKIFPFAFVARELQAFIIMIVMHVLAAVLFGVLIWALGMIPFIGIILGILSTLVDIYLLGSIVLSILYFVKVID